MLFKSVSGLSALTRCMAHRGYPNGVVLFGPGDHNRLKESRQ